MLFALEQNMGAALAYSGWQNLGVAGGESFYEVPDKQTALLVGNRWPIHVALTRKERIIEARGSMKAWPLPKITLSCAPATPSTLR